MAVARRLESSAEVKMKVGEGESAPGSAQDAEPGGAIDGVEQGASEGDGVEDLGTLAEGDEVEGAVGDGGGVEGGGDGLEGFFGLGEDGDAEFAGEGLSLEGLGVLPVGLNEVDDAVELGGAGGGGAGGVGEGKLAAGAGEGEVELGGGAGAGEHGLRGGELDAAGVGGGEDLLEVGV